MNKWIDLDDQAVAISRALAMDAVQKVGNGHPGTAMALAPVAYTLFQRILRHISQTRLDCSGSIYSLLWALLSYLIHSALFIRVWRRA